MRFNPPPGWRTPPGFEPDAGWAPDPSWPPAPPSWEYWVDDATEAFTPARANGPATRAVPAAVGGGHATMLIPSLLDDDATVVQATSPAPAAAPAPASRRSGVVALGPAPVAARARPESGPHDTVVLDSSQLVDAPRETAPASRPRPAPAGRGPAAPRGLSAPLVAAGVGGLCAGLVIGLIFAFMAKGSATDESSKAKIEQAAVATDRKALTTAQKQLEEDQASLADEQEQLAKDQETLKSDQDALADREDAVKQAEDDASAQQQQQQNDAQDQGQGQDQDQSQDQDGTAQQGRYWDCSAAKNDGVAPLHQGDPGYNKVLDWDGDGVICDD